MGLSYIHDVKYLLRQEANGEMVNELIWRAKLADARRRRVPWHQIACAIEALRAWRSHDDHGLPWVTYAAQVSGYTPVALREMLRTYAACVELSTKAHVSLDTLVLALPMYALEIITRISNVDQQKAIETIASYMRKKIAVGDLKQIYSETKETHPNRASNTVIGKKVYGDFEKTCFRALTESRQVFVEEIRRIYPAEKADFPIQLVRWMSKSKRFNPSFALIEYVDDNHRRINALDCALLQGWSEDKIVQKLIYVDFVSQSFSRFWLLVPSRADLDLALKLVRQLEIAGIGLMSVNSEDLRITPLMTAPLNDTIRRETLIERELLLQRASQFGKDLSSSDMDLSASDVDEDLAYFFP